MTEALNILILSGGDSAERAISLQSGASVAAALTERGHRVEVHDVAAGWPCLSDVDAEILLPVIHGTGGEDGPLQQWLEHCGRPWYGCSSIASELTFNKAATRERLRQSGIPVPPGVILDANAPPVDIERSGSDLGFPLVVKPVAQGSSIGVSVVTAPEHLAEAVIEARRWSASVLMEAYIPGRELTVPVVEGTPFPAIEIRPAGSWFDYGSKYEDNRTDYCVSPPNIPKQLIPDVVRACRLCGVCAVSRTDLRLTEDGRYFILEINTIPGMTSHSLVPMSAAALGISIGFLYEQLLLRQLGRIHKLPWLTTPADDLQAA